MLALSTMVERWRSSVKSAAFHRPSLLCQVEYILQLGAQAALLVSVCVFLLAWAPTCYRHPCFACEPHN